MVKLSPFKRATTGSIPVRPTNLKGKAMVKCDRIGCTNTATKMFEFQLGVKDLNVPTVDGMLGVHVCAEHATQEEGDELIRIMLERLATEIKQRGLRMPDQYRFVWLPMH